MALTWGSTRVYVAWTAVVVCLGSLGCRAQFALDDDAPLQAAGATAPAPKPDAPPAVAAAPARPAVVTVASYSPPDPDPVPVVTPAVKTAAREMGVAALTGKAPDPALFAPPISTASAAQDAPVRFVPHFPAGQLTPPVVQASGQAPDASDGGKPDPIMPQNPADAPPAFLQEASTPVVQAPPRMSLPTEKAKTTLPAYVIEPPDVLIIDGVRLIPRPPYRVEPLDVLLVSVPNTLPGQPIAGPYTVTPDGTVNLGFGYGAFRVVGLTLEQAATAIKGGLRLNNPQVSVALGQFRGIQQVRGEHMVGQDGTISLGTYGCVNVTGLTLSQAKCEIERHLARWLQDPLLSVAIGGYNSKVYYVITDGGGFGQQVFRLPITGNETVLDAISLINGLPPVASKRNIWLARPTPARHGCYEILPVNWEAITEAGSTETNWQLFPGDRVYVKADCLITIDNTLAKVLNPIERLMGGVLLGTATAQSFRFNNNGNNGF